MNSYKVSLVRAANAFIRNVQVVLSWISKKRLPPFCSVLALIEKDGQVFVINHLVHKVYSFPGGYVQIGEAPTDAIIREMIEETGIKVRPIRIVGCYKNKIGMHSINIIYLCEIQSDGDAVCYEGRCGWMDARQVYDLMPTHCQDAMNDYMSSKQLIAEDQRWGGVGQNHSRW